MGCLIATFVVDKFGRKPLLALSTFAMSISIITLGIFFYMDENKKCSYRPDGVDVDESIRDEAEEGVEGREVSFSLAGPPPPTGLHIMVSPEFFLVAPPTTPPPQSGNSNCGVTGTSRQGCCS